MPRVRLRLFHHGRSLEYSTPAPQTSPFLRLMADLLLGTDPSPGELDSRRLVSAALDTGSPFSLIDHGTWESFEQAGLLDIVDSTATRPPLTIAGMRSLPYRLGVMPVAVVERRQQLMRSLPAVPVLFQLLDRPAGLPFPVILGLHRGILDGRWLTRQPVSPIAVAENRHDYGPVCGEQWWLQDEPPRI